MAFFVGSVVRSDTGGKCRGILFPANGATDGIRNRAALRRFGGRGRSEVGRLRGRRVSGGNGVNAGEGASLNRCVCGRRGCGRSGGGVSVRVGRLGRRLREVRKSRKFTTLGPVCGFCRGAMAGVLGGACNGRGMGIVASRCNGA